jgi:hypothetical protein
MWGRWLDRSGVVVVIVVVVVIIVVVVIVAVVVGKIIGCNVIIVAQVASTSRGCRQYCC